MTVKKVRNWKSTLQVAVLIVVWFFIGWVARGYSGIPLSQKTDLVGQAKQAIFTKAFAPPASEAVMNSAAIQAISESIGDRYAHYETPLVHARREAQRNGSGQAIIGIRGEMQAGAFVITQVTPGGPADRNGLLAGDQIVEIDGWAVPPDATPDLVLLMIRDSEASIAHLTYRRAGQVYQAEIQREIEPVVDYRMLDGQTGYLRFDYFGKNTPAAIEEALAALLEQDAAGLVLDLRYNSGGAIPVQAAVLDCFMGEGDGFFIQSRQGKLQVAKMTGDDIGESLPMVILIGPGTASAAEMLAASLHDVGRATLMGQVTFGKGAIIESVTLSDGSVLTFTVAHYLTPVSRRDFDGVGLTPDIAIAGDFYRFEQDDPALTSAMAYLSR